MRNWWTAWCRSRKMHPFSWTGDGSPPRACALSPFISPTSTSTYSGIQKDRFLYLFWEIFYVSSENFPLHPQLFFAGVVNGALAFVTRYIAINFSSFFYVQWREKENERSVPYHYIHLHCNIEWCGTLVGTAVQMKITHIPASRRAHSLRPGWSTL